MGSVLLVTLHKMRARLRKWHPLYLPMERSNMLLPRRAICGVYAMPEYLKQG